MQARQLMHPDPEVVTVADSVAKAARLMRGRGVAVLAVVEDRANRLAVGAVTDPHLLLDCVAAGHEPRRCPIWNHVQKDVVRLSPDRSVDPPAPPPAGSMLDRTPVLVVDKDGRLAGVVEEPTVAASLAGSSAGGGTDTETQ